MTYKEFKHSDAFYQIAKEVSRCKKGDKIYVDMGQFGNEWIDVKPEWQKINYDVIALTILAKSPKRRWRKKIRQDLGVDFVPMTWPKL